VNLLWVVMSPLEEHPETATYHRFQRDIGGSLKVWLKPRWRYDHLELFIDDGVEYSIINGCWVHSHAPGILQSHGDNRISCIMMIPHGR
jgi:hypothetical protein